MSTYLYIHTLTTEKQQREKEHESEQKALSERITHLQERVCVLLFCCMDMCSLCLVFLRSSLSWFIHLFVVSVLV